MRIRADSVVISSVLFTIALLSLIPAALRNAIAGRDKTILAKLDAGFQAESQTASYLGIACLAIILIGLIVIWTGYVNRGRSAWLVMSVVTWLWAFPLLVVPLFSGTIALTEWLYSAIYEAGLPRSAAESVLIFLLMVIALLLPIRSFFFVGEMQGRPIRRPSLKLISGFAAIVLLAGIALVAWIRVGVVYEIPPAVLNARQELPPPPPPPQKPCNTQ